jgi:predicted acylesterase/phospholipase RssA
MIKHLVLPGAGINILSLYGLIKAHALNETYKISEIESIYGTSAGALISVMLMLKLTWDELDKYFIERPWEKLFKITPDTILASYTNCGLFDETIIEQIFTPLFKSKDINPKINLKEFNELTKIEFHVSTIDIEKWILLDISWKSHPDLTIIKALYMTCCIPILFSPCLYNEEPYLDGGVIAETRIDLCYEINKANAKEILYVTCITDFLPNDTRHMTMFNYLMLIIDRLKNNKPRNDALNRPRNDINYENECYFVRFNPIINNDLSSLSRLMCLISDKEYRKEVIKIGNDNFKQHLLE